MVLRDRAGRRGFILLLQCFWILTLVYLSCFSKCKLRGFHLSATSQLVSPLCLQCCPVNTKVKYKTKFFFSNRCPTFLAYILLNETVSIACWERCAISSLEFCWFQIIYNNDPGAQQLKGEPSEPSQKTHYISISTVLLSFPFSSNKKTLQNLLLKRWPNNIRFASEVTGVNWKKTEKTEIIRFPDIVARQRKG